MSYRPTENPGIVAILICLMIAAVLCAAAYVGAGNAGRQAAVKEAKPIPFIVEERTKSNAPDVTEDGEMCYTTSKDPFIREICKDFNDAYEKKQSKKK